jgi:signal peptidase I
MPLENLEKLRVVGGDDMSPRINPKEFLLLDKKSAPQLGDVVVFENKFGYRIAHRLLHRFGGYYFMKGDRCTRFNFPVRKDKIFGVVVGKRRPVKKNMFAGLLLALFLPQFVLYSKLYDLRKKKYFLLLSMASKYYPPLEVSPDGKLL